ncbi:hypothetical protein AB2L28_13455 [Kineococcus sp. TBRC 1896]|uniref:Uncharacterized protein n=1 Tax=Kineococcus mangrovi TaxID=1660183 RepID=A0ABV4I6C2_9ACTN
MTSSTSSTCPTCGHALAAELQPAPDVSVVRWFRDAPAWSGMLSTDEVYGQYLRATDDAPVSRRRFVSDLAYLGVEEVLDEETFVLDRQ